MGNHKDDIQVLQNKINDLINQIDKIQDERFKLEDNIRRIVANFMLVIKHIKVTPSNIDLGTKSCKDSPTGSCVYDENCRAGCLVCGKLFE